MEGMTKVELAIVRGKQQARLQPWELERAAATRMRKAELDGDKIVILTGAENTALLTWIRRVEES
jgi:hypothetical protein